MLTYGNAVLDLERLGYLRLFEKSKEAFREYCAVTRRGPSKGATRQIPVPFLCIPHCIVISRCGTGAKDYPEPEDYQCLARSI